MTVQDDNPKERVKVRLLPMTTEEQQAFWKRNTPHARDEFALVRALVSKGLLGKEVKKLVDKI
jgi:hypothetical protein